MKRFTGIWLLLLTINVNSQIILTTIYETPLKGSPNVSSSIRQIIPSHLNVLLLDYLPGGNYKGYFRVIFEKDTGFIDKGSVACDNGYYNAILVKNGNVKEIYAQNKSEIDKSNKIKIYEEKVWKGQDSFKPSNYTANSNKISQPTEVVKTEDKSSVGYKTEKKTTLKTQSVDVKPSIKENIQNGDIKFRGEQKKLALVIGNGNYLSSILANPENDAKAMKIALQNVGFTVIEYENLNQASMKKAIDNFGEKLKNYDVGLFYFAGHGIQAKGFNYLIPVDAQLKSEEQVDYDCVRADRVLSLMEGNGLKVNIIILDACRNNPFERSWTRSASGRGLAFMDAPRGTIIAYATSPGNTASDGNGKNGLYTSAILESIQIPDITIIQMFQNVRNLVSQKSQNQQMPWESTSLTGDFYFLKTTK